MALIAAATTIVLLLLALLFLLRVRMSYTYVLAAKVGTVDGLRYAVSFRKLRPEIQDVEYIWLSLFFAAKTLYIIGNQERLAEAKGLLISLLEALGTIDLSSESRLPEITFQPIDVVVEIPTPKAKCISAKVAFINPAMRHIWTGIPWSGFQLQYPHSFLAIVQGVLPRLDPDLCRLMRQCFREMSRIYRENEVDPVTLDGLTAAPHHAFWIATHLMDCAK